MYEPIETGAHAGPGNILSVGGDRPRTRDGEANPNIKGRHVVSVSIEELQYSNHHRGWQARPDGQTAAVGNGASWGTSMGRRPRSKSESAADEMYEKLSLLWPTFRDACFDSSVKAVAAGILPRVDIVNRVDYLWMAIPRIALTDMLLRSMTQDGLRTRDGEVLAGNAVHPDALALYMDLCNIKHTMSASSLSRLESATLRRIVVYGGQHAKSQEWMDALSGVMANIPGEDEAAGWSSEEGYGSQEESLYQCGHEADDDEDLTGLGRSRRAGPPPYARRRQQIVLQLAARCSAALEPAANSSRFSLDISKVLTRLDEALAPTTYVFRSSANIHGGGPDAESVPPVPPEEFEPTVFIGARHRWCVGKMVGYGAYGKVFAAWLVDADGRNGRKIALKEVEVVGKKAGMVEREISILSALTHPHIIGLLGSERTEAMLFILMEFAAAGSLARLCAERKGLPEKVARKFLAQMLLGLEYLHANGIIHRDVKGGNCLLFPPPPSVGTGARVSAADDSDMMVKLADFGASRMFEQGFGEAQGTGVDPASTKHDSQSSGGPQVSVCMTSVCDLSAW